jgi:mono/diheme cytochrome c family protein
MRLLLKAVWHLSALVGLAVISGGLWFASQGMTARTTPSPMEISVARRARNALIPAAERARTSPEPASTETIRSGMAHWADHCASCHANDGSGETPMGTGLYPRVPDMRQADTQQLRDGELFYIIENGVKLTGMPAWGTGPDGEPASWHLVHFIRKLPTLTDAELAEMAELNPKSAEEWKAAEDEQKFLAGEDKPPAQPAPVHKH